jgi:hypothetical protein
MYLVASITGHRTYSMQSKIKEKDFDIERALKLINKSPVKSIQVFQTLLTCHYMILFVELDLTIHGLIIFLLFDYGFRQNLDILLIALILINNRLLIILYLRIISCKYALS